MFDQLVLGKEPGETSQDIVMRSDNLSGSLAIPSQELLDGFEMHCRYDGLPMVGAYMAIPRSPVDRRGPGTRPGHLAGGSNPNKAVSWFLSRQLFKLEGAPPRCK